VGPASCCQRDSSSLDGVSETPQALLVPTPQRFRIVSLEEQSSDPRAFSISVPSRLVSQNAASSTPAML
jgi:hypothetical protein